LSSTGGALTSSSNPEPDKPIDPQAEYDRLMHARKGISGSEFAGLGIQFAITIVAFAFAGIWLDRRLGASPVFVIIMVLGGAGLGFWTMYRKATKKAGK
jgi:F0F1-type ATP synthase assembly protein I